MLAQVTILEDLRAILDKMQNEGNVFHKRLFIK
jgi:hypothetical protein